MTTMEKEIKVLQQKIDLMKTVESVITSTMSEVEDLLKTENNPKSLAVLVASLKRELRSSEGRRSELRSVLKSTQQDCRKEQELRKRLEEKISQIESENFKLNEEVNYSNLRLISRKKLIIFIFGCRNGIWKRICIRKWSTSMWRML